MTSDTPPTHWPAPRLNGFLVLPDTLSAEIMGRAGFDMLTIDMQHGAMGYREAFLMLQVLAGCPVEPWVRVPGPEAGLIQKCLDGGALGIICPMVETVADVRAFVSACSYPPRGIRSFGPIRPMLTEGLAYGDTANDRVKPIVMIETRAALEAIDDILAVEGLAGVYIGPTDLGMALGLPPGSDREDDVFLDAITRISTAAAAKGRMVCMHTGSAAYARAMAGRGFDVVTVAADYDLLNAAARERVIAVKADPPAA